MTANIKLIRIGTCNSLLFFYQPLPLYISDRLDAQLKKVK
jgi:hypothetical protein